MGEHSSVGRDEIAGEMFMKAVSKQTVQVGYCISDSEFVFYLVIAILLKMILRR